MEACLYLFTGISPQSVATKLIKNTAKISVFDETAESVRLVHNIVDICTVCWMSEIYLKRCDNRLGEPQVYVCIYLVRNKTL